MDPDPRDAGGTEGPPVSPPDKPDWIARDAAGWRLLNANECRVVGRIWGGVVIALVSMTVLAFGGPAKDLSNPKEIADLVLWILVLEGLLIAWTWEFTGSLVALAAVAADVLLNWQDVAPLILRREGIPIVVLIVLPTIPALLLLASALLRPPSAPPNGEADAADPTPEPETSPAAVVTAHPRPNKDAISHRDKLIVLAATLAIPVVFGLGLNRSRITYHLTGAESVIASLKTLVMAEEQYKATASGGVYTTLARLSSTTPQYVDSVLGAGKKGGYSFVLTVGTPASANWTATASPIKRGKTRNRFFFVDSSGVVRFHPTRPATSLDSPIE